MKRKLLIIISLLSALFPFNVFASPYPADVDTGIIQATQDSERFIVSINQSYYYAFGSNTTQVYYRVSFDGGVTWSTDTILETVTTASIGGLSVWYDRWTPGSSGTLIHIAYSVKTTSGNNSRLRYTNLDVQTNTAITAVTVASVSSNTPISQLSITKAVGGNLYIASQASYDPAGTSSFFRSTNAGVTWGNRANFTAGCGGNTGTSKFCSLVPSNNTSNTNDVFGCGSNTAAILSCGFYDDTGNAWTFANVFASANVRVGQSISVAIDAVGTIWITGSWVNGALEDIKSFICVVNCTAPVERTNIVTAGTFSGVVTRTRITVFGVGGLNAGVTISGQTTTSGIKYASSANNGGAWSSPATFNQSNLSTQVLKQSIPENSQISNAIIPAIWNYSSPNGHYFMNFASTPGIVAATPTPVAKIWYEKLVDKTTNNDQGWGRALWMAGGTALFMILLMIVGAPAYMYLATIVLAGSAYLSIQHLPGELAVIAVMLVGMVLVLMVVAGKGKSEDKT